MNLTNRQLKGFIFAFEGVGAVFVGLFLSVYLFGLRELPRDVVYHSEPLLRTALSVLGIVLIGLVVIAVLASFVTKRKD